MNTKEDQRKETMSFSLWALACEAIPQLKGLPQTRSGQAWMPPQSKGGPVLGLHSCSALSPEPRQEHGGRGKACHGQKEPGRDC
jgi:hypothetical protein